MWDNIVNVENKTEGVRNRKGYIRKYFGAIQIKMNILKTDYQEESRIF